MISPRWIHKQLEFISSAAAFVKTRAFTFALTILLSVAGCTTSPNAMILDKLTQSSTEYLFAGKLLYTKQAFVTELAADCKNCNVFFEYYVDIATFKVDPIKNNSDTVNVIVYSENCILNSEDGFYIVLANRRLLDRPLVSLYSDIEDEEKIMESVLCKPLSVGEHNSSKNDKTDQNSEDSGFDAEIFGNYFRSSYNIQDSVELQLRFSSKFIEQFEKHCLISTTVSAFLTSMGSEAIYSSSIENQSASTLSTSSFYISGFNGKFDLILRYSVEGCNNTGVEGDKYKEITFSISDVSDVPNAEIGRINN